MKKDEVEKKLNEIHEKLNALGDLQALLTAAGNLPSVVSAFEQTQKTADEILPKLAANQEQVEALKDELTGLKDTLSENNDEASELITQTEELQDKTEKLRQETLVQLGLAASEKLSNSFEQVKIDLVTEKQRWFTWLKISVGALIFFTVAITVWQVLEHGSLYNFSFLIKIALTSPLVYFTVFINREYSRARNLIEEYTFKAAIARSFEAYKEILEDAFADQQSDIFKQKLEFMLDAVKSLYSSPMRNIKRNHTKEQELAPDLITQIRNTFTQSIPENKD